MTRISNAYNNSVNETLKKMRNMDPIDFQDMIIEDIFDGISSGVDKNGIDGYASNGSPIQVKRSDKVGKRVMTYFSYNIRDDGKKRGYVVAFSFTNSVHDIVSTIKKRYGINIILVTVEDLLRQNKYPMSLEVVKKRLTKKQRKMLIDSEYIYISVNKIFRLIESRHVSDRGYISVYYVKQKKR